MIVPARSSGPETAAVLELLAGLLGGPVRVRSLASRGFRSAWAGIVTVVGTDRTVFVKARSAPSLSALDHERTILERLPPGLGPSVCGWCRSSDDAIGILALEDLSANRWPPPWTVDDVVQTIELLERVATVGPGVGALPRLVDVASNLTSWSAVAEDPEPFLRTFLRSERWLYRVLPAVLDLTVSDSLDGEGLVHFDVRSDNISFGNPGPVLVDWEFACLGNPRVDLLSWLPSLRAEGGPEPWVVVPDAELELIAFLAGYWSSQAGLPEPSHTPGLRSLQRAQASVALDWFDNRVGQIPGRR